MNKALLDSLRPAMKTAYQNFENMRKHDPIVLPKFAKIEADPIPGCGFKKAQTLIRACVVQVVTALLDQRDHCFVSENIKLVKLDKLAEQTGVLISIRRVDRANIDWSKHDSAQGYFNIRYALIKSDKPLAKLFKTREEDRAKREVLRKTRVAEAKEAEERIECAIIKEFPCLLAAGMKSVTLSNVKYELQGIPMQLEWPRHYYRDDLIESNPPL